MKRGLVVAGVMVALLAGSLMAIPLMAGPALVSILQPKSASAFCGGSVSAQNLDAEQQKNASIIIGVIQSRGLPQIAAVIAITTALTESGLHNHLTATDHDSLGLFQQRPSQGWGSPAQVTDPIYATGKFLDHLVNVQGWQTMPVELAAQAVQRSAFADGSNYKRFVSQATGIVGGFQPSASCLQPTGGGIVGALPKGPIAAPGVVISRGLPLVPLFPGVPVGGFPTSGFPWGQCTWFAAYQHRVPGWPGHGDGGQWYGDAIADHIAVSNAPTVGSVVSYRAGGRYSGFGHVAVVVAVPGDGTMVVEESNYVGLGVLDQRVDPLNDPDILGFIVG